MGYIYKNSTDLEEIYRDLYLDSLPVDYDVYPLSYEEKRAIDEKVKSKEDHCWATQLWGMFHGDKQMYLNNTYLLFKVFDQLAPKKYSCIEISPDLVRKLVSGSIGYSLNGACTNDDFERAKHLLTDYLDVEEKTYKAMVGSITCFTCPGGGGAIINKNLKGDEMRFISYATTPCKCTKIKLHFEDIQPELCGS